MRSRVAAPPFCMLGAFSPWHQWRANSFAKTGQELCSAIAVQAVSRGCEDGVQDGRPRMLFGRRIKEEEPFQPCFSDRERMRREKGGDGGDWQANW